MKIPGRSLLPSPPTVRGLRRLELRFQHLFAEADCLSDPAKRHALLAARLRYQDARLALFEFAHL